MSITLGFVEIGILILMAFALVAIVVAFLLPRRIRPADIGERPEVREAFRANLIQTMTLLLVVLGAAVGSPPRSRVPKSVSPPPAATS